MHLANFMGPSRIVEHAFGDGRLTGVNVRNDAYIADMLYLIGFFHRVSNRSAVKGKVSGTCPASVRISVPSINKVTRSISETLRTRELTIENSVNCSIRQLPG